MFYFRVFMLFFLIHFLSACSDSDSSTQSSNSSATETTQNGDTSNNTNGSTTPETPDNTITTENKPNSFPIAKNILINDANGGSIEVGDILSGSYEYFDAEGDEEGQTIFLWLRDGKAIEGATTQKYAATVQDVGKKISFEVTPVALTGSISSEENIVSTSSVTSVVNNTPVMVAQPIQQPAKLSMGKSVTINNVKVVANDDDPGYVPTTIRSGEVYNFNIDINSIQTHDAKLSIMLALIPDHRQNLQADEVIPVEFGKGAIFLDSEESNETIPHGDSTISIHNVMIPTEIEKEENYILVAYMHDEEIHDGYEAQVDNNTSKTVKAVVVALLPKEENDISIHHVNLLDELAFIETNKTHALKDGYTITPFAESEIELFNNGVDAQATIKAVWETPDGQEFPLYFYEEGTGRMVESETIMVPHSKRAEGDVVSKIHPTVYPAELHASEAGWTEMQKYAGNPSKGEPAFSAKIKFKLDPSPANQRPTDDIFEVSHYMLKVSGTSVVDNANDDQQAGNVLGKSRLAHKTETTTDDLFSETERDFYEYKKEWDKDWGNKSKVSLGFKAGINTGVDIVPVPTIDAVGLSGIYLNLFNNEIKMIEYQLQFAEGMNLVVDSKKDKKYKFKHGSKSKFTLFNVVITDQGEMGEKEADKNAGDSKSIEDAKEDVNKGTLLQKLEFTKEWKEEKELFKREFLVGPVPLTIGVKVSFEMPVKLGIEPTVSGGLGLQLAGSIQTKVNIIADGGVGLSFASAGMTVDFLVVDTQPNANAGAKFVYDTTSSQFSVNIFTNGELPIEAVKGTIGLYAEASIKLPCGISWSGIKFCKVGKRFDLDLYNTPAVVSRTDSNAFELWKYEKPVIAFDLTKWLGKTELIPEGSTAGGPWGSWHSAVTCADGELANGFKLRVEANQGSGDDTALNGIRIYCKGKDDTSPKEIVANDSASEGTWGDWGTPSYCSAGYLTAYKLRLEASQGGGDDTAANDVKFNCSDGSEINATNGGSWGDWKTGQNCPTGKYICGIRSKIEPSQGSGDDTSMNDLSIICCSN